MPWHAEQSAACPANEPWAVIKDPDGSLVACHESEDRALAQVAALYAAEPEAREAVSVPSYVAANARRGLEHYEEGRGGDGLVDATIRSARQMAAGEVTDDKVRLMGPWIARHLADLDAPQNSDPGDPGYPGPGLVAMLLWGAGPSKEDARRTMEWAERTAAGLEDETREAGWYTPATGDSGGNGIVLTKMLEAMCKSLESELASLSPVEEVGRVFSTRNEMALRAVVDAINSLLAQLATAPVAADNSNDEDSDEEVVVITQPVTQSEEAPVAPEAVEAAGPVEVIAEEAAAAPISEAARTKGLIKVIDSGWGSSGYYSKEVLARDASAAFPAGTKMYWDHPTKDEAEARPERSLRDLAAETTGDAAWMDEGPEGPGVYAPAKVFATYAPAIEELAPHIGVSIRASAMVKSGKAEDRSGAIIEKLLPHPTNSIDFVTIPGRGGRIANLFEAARGRNVDIITNTAVEAAPASDEAERLRGEVETLRSSLEEAVAARDAALVDRDAARGEVVALKAAALVNEAIAASDLPAAARARVSEACLTSLPKGEFDEAAVRESVGEKVAAERAYIAEVAASTGVIRNMGTPAPVAEAVEVDMSEAFRRLGLGDNAAKIAATGRR